MVDRRVVVTERRDSYDLGLEADRLELCGSDLRYLVGTVLRYWLVRSDISIFDLGGLVASAAAVVRLGW